MFLTKLKSPERYKKAVYLHYHKGYSGREVAAELDIKQATALKYLSRARNSLSRAEIDEIIKNIQNVNEPCKSDRPQSSVTALQGESPAISAVGGMQPSVPPYPHTHKKVNHARLIIIISIIIFILTIIIPIIGGNTGRWDFAANLTLPAAGDDARQYETPPASELTEVYNEFSVVHNLLRIVESANWHNNPGVFDISAVDGTYGVALELSGYSVGGDYGGHMVVGANISMDVRNNYYVYISGGLSSGSHAEWSFAIDFANEYNEIIPIRSTYLSWHGFDGYRFDNRFNGGYFDLTSAVDMVSDWYGVEFTPRLALREIRIWSNLTSSNSITLDAFFIGTRT